MLADVIKLLEKKNKIITNLINNTENEVINMINQAPILFTIISYIIETNQLENFIELDKCILNFDMRRPGTFILNTLIIFYSLKESSCSDDKASINYDNLSSEEIREIFSLVRNYNDKFYPIIKKEIKKINETVEFIKVNEDERTDDIFIEFDHMFIYYVLLFLHEEKNAARELLDKVSKQTIMRFMLTE